jgi:lipoprotein signal peptidase
MSTNDYNNSLAPEVIFPVMFFSATFLNIFFTLLLRNNGHPFIPNKYIFNLPLNLIFISIIVFFISYGFYKFKYYLLYPTITSIILAGIWSNLLERVFFGNVADYLPLFYSYINLADVQICIGLLALNYHIWIRKSAIFS